MRLIPRRGEANHFKHLEPLHGSDFGGGCAKLQELSGPVVSIAYKLSWEREYLDLKELARLRWIEHWKIERLADYFAVSPTAIKERLRALKKRPIDVGIPISSKIIRGS